jgi:hypothetical protein
VLENINNVDFEIKDNKFIFRICSDGSISFDDLIEEKKNYDIGIQYNVSVIADAMKLSGYLIYFDDKLLFEGDKIFEIPEDKFKKTK